MSHAVSEVHFIFRSKYMYSCTLYTVSCAYLDLNLSDKVQAWMNIYSQLVGFIPPEPREHKWNITIKIKIYNVLHF